MEARQVADVIDGFIGGGQQLGGLINFQADHIFLRGDMDIVHKNFIQVAAVDAEMPGDIFNLQVIEVVVIDKIHGILKKPLNALTAVSNLDGGEKFVKRTDQIEMNVEGGDIGLQQLVEKCDRAFGIHRLIDRVLATQTEILQELTGHNAIKPNPDIVPGVLCVCGIGGGGTWLDEKALTGYRNDIEDFANLSLEIFQVKVKRNGKMVTPEANKPKRPSNMLELQW